LKCKTCAEGFYQNETDHRETACKPQVLCNANNATDQYFYAPSAADGEGAADYGLCVPCVSGTYFERKDHREKVCLPDGAPDPDSMARGDDIDTAPDDSISSSNIILIVVILFFVVSLTTMNLVTKAKSKKKAKAAADAELAATDPDTYRQAYGDGTDDHGGGAAGGAGEGMYEDAAAAAGGYGTLGYAGAGGAYGEAGIAETSLGGAGAGAAAVGTSLGYEDQYGETAYTDASGGANPLAVVTHDGTAEALLAAHAVGEATRLEAEKILVGRGELAAVGAAGLTPVMGDFVVRASKGTSVLTMATPSQSKGHKFVHNKLSLQGGIVLVNGKPPKGTAPSIAQAVQGWVRSTGNAASDLAGSIIDVAARWTGAVLSATAGEAQVYGSSVPQGPAGGEDVYAPRAVQSHPHGGQFDFARLPARTRPMGVHRTCGAPGETTENTHPKNITALFRDRDHDQVNVACFNASASVRRWMAERGPVKRVVT